MTAVHESKKIHEAASGPDVVTAYRAAWDLQAFTGDVAEATFHDMLRSAGVDPAWLSGERWAVLSDLWRRQVPPSRAARVLGEHESR